MANEHTSGFEFGNRLKTFKVYMIGLASSLLLTLAAFGVVAAKPDDETGGYLILSILAIIQLIVQSICFLRLNASPVGRWNLFPFLFTLMIITFLVGGSLWIMYNLNYNMV